MENLGKEIQDIKSRNRRVEADKAWETSWFRIITLTVITYVVALVVLVISGLSKPFLGALVPAVGFFLSVQSLPFIKRWWVKRYEKKRRKKEKPPQQIQGGVERRINGRTI